MNPLQLRSQKCPVQTLRSSHVQQHGRRKKAPVLQAVKNEPVAVPKKPKKAKVGPKIGSVSYRTILVKLNKERKANGNNSVLIEVAALGNYFEAWLTYGMGERVLLEDSIMNKNTVLNDVTTFRRYLLERKFNVEVKEVQ